MSRVYCAGPMTGYPANNYPAFNAAARELSKAGFEVLNPAELGQPYGWDWEDYIKAGLQMLLTCDAVALLPGWGASRGARLEKRVAEACGLEVADLSMFLFLGGSNAKPPAGVEASTRLRDTDPATAEMY